MLSSEATAQHDKSLFHNFLSKFHPNMTPMIAKYYTEILENLHKNGADINDQNNTHKHTPLMVAILRDNKLAINFFLKSKADVNLVDAKLCCALHYAVKLPYPELIKTLIKKGAQPELLNQDGKSAITIAGQHYHRVLSDARLNTQPPPSQYQTDIIKNYHFTIKALLEGSKDINTCDYFGNTLLHLAVLEDNVEKVTALLAKGIHPELKTRYHLTALDYARVCYAKDQNTWLGYSSSFFMRSNMKKIIIILSKQMEYVQERTMDSSLSSLKI